MSETITSKMRDARNKLADAEIKLCEAYTALKIKDPEIRAHMDVVFGVVDTKKSKTPLPKLAEGESFATGSTTPKANPNFPGPRPS